MTVGIAVTCVQRKTPIKFDVIKLNVKVTWACILKVVPAKYQENVLT